MTARDRAPSRGRPAAAGAPTAAPSPPAVDRSRLPEPGPTPPVSLPSIARSTLTNGMRVWTVRHPALPVVTLRLLIGRGSAADPPGREGLAALTLDMLDEGSGARNAIEIHEALARIGAQLDSDITGDAIVMTITTLGRFVGQALHLLGDMVVRPSMTDADFLRVRQLRLHRLAQLRDVPGAVADRAFARLLYGEHPYGHMPLGTERALGATAIDEVRGFHASMLGPDEGWLIAVGDCDHEAVARFAGEAFADWGGGTTALALPPATGPLPPRLNAIPRPRAPQSELRIGHIAAPRDTPDYHALVTLNAVLGGQFVSRINLNLREDKGLTYGARTAFDLRRLPGPFTVQVSVQTNGTAEAIREALAEVAGIRDVRPVTPDELALAVAALTRGYARNFETAEQVARAVTQIALYGLPDSYFSEFVPRIERLTPADLTDVAVRYLDPGRLTTLVVGDVEEMTAELTGLGLGDPVVVETESF